MTNRTIALQAEESCSRAWGGGIWMAFLLLVSSTASAQLSIGPYTIDGGGGTSENGPNKITGTIGQPLAGVVAGGDVGISGGFWPAVAQTSDTTPTPTPMETVTETPTASGPTATPTPSEPDLDIGDPDGFIDAKDLLEILARLRELGIDPQVLFRLIVYWQGEYPAAASPKAAGFQPDALNQGTH